MSKETVNSPDHYNAGGIECIDAIRAALTPEEFRGFCKGNSIKYVWRMNHKGSKIQDVSKAQWYLQKLKDCIDGDMEKIEDGFPPISFE